MVKDSKDTVLSYGMYPALPLSLKIICSRMHVGRTRFFTVPHNAILYRRQYYTVLYAFYYTLHTVQVTDIKINPQLT